MLKSTQLRFLKAKNPDELTRLVGALPFKVEIKSIQKDGKSYICFFTILDEYAKLTNEKLGVISGR